MEALALLAALIAGVVIGMLIQAWRSAKATGTTVREQIKIAGGPGPVVPK